MRVHGRCALASAVASHKSSAPLPASGVCCSTLYLHQVLLFTDKNVTTVLYKGLSWAYPRRLLFAEVQKSEDTQPLIEQYGVAEFPTLLVVKVSRAARAAAASRVTQDETRSTAMALAAALDK